MSAVARLLDDLEPQELEELANRLRPFLESSQRPAGLLSPAEAATQLGIHSKTLTRAAKAGRVLGAQQVGRSWRFDAATLAVYPPTADRPEAASSARRRRTTSHTSDAIRGARDKA